MIGEVCPVQVWEEPPSAELVLESAAGVLMLAHGAWLVGRSKPRLLPLWLAAFASWFTICKYLICTRCERFGQRCEFYGLGKYAERLFRAQPGKTLDRAGVIAEGASAGTLYFLPLAASLGRPGESAKYLLTLAAALLAQFFISCRRCALTATTPWKATCPNYRLARKVFI